MSDNRLSPTSAAWLADTIARNRARFGGWRMEAEPTPDPPTPGEPDKEPTFTQADVDRIVRERVKRERDKFADYDDLKERAGSAVTLEERVAEIERTARDAEQRAMRAEIANAKGLTPSQAKRLVGSTREELEADADELLADIGAQKQNGNHAPREGNTPQATDDPMRAFATGIFERARNS